MSHGARDRFVLVAPLAAGGQGSIWLAEDTLVTNRKVALKRVTATPLGVATLRREFAILGRLHHPHLPRVYDLGKGIAGTAEHYLASEFVDGEPFDSYVRQASERDVMRVFAQLLATLDFLHQRRLVHRDVKPQNVLVVRGHAGGPPQAKLVDFGLATPIQPAQATAGTLGYLAPEVLRGAAATPQSDLYALGAMLFQHRFGRAPYSGAPGERLAKQLRDAEPEWPAAERETPFGGLLAGLLCPDPVQRAASAGEVLLHLAELVGLSPGELLQVTVGQGVPEPALIGRDALLARLEHLLDGLERGQGPRGVLLVAEPGQGRARLQGELGLLARLRGLGVVRSVADSLPAQRTVSLAVAAIDPAAMAAQDAERLVTGLRARVAAGPLVLLLERGDEQLVRRVMRALQGMAPRTPLLVCAAVDAGGELEQAELSSEMELLRLRPLVGAEVGQLVRSMVPASLVSEAAITRCFELAGGNPRLAVELTRRAVLQLIAKGSAVGGLLQAFDSADVAATVGEAALDRSAELGPSALELLLLLHVLWDDGLPVTLLAEPELSDGAKALQCLEREGFVHEDAGARLRLSRRALGAAALSRVDERRRGALFELARRVQGGANADVLAVARLLSGLGLAARDPALVLQGARRALACADLRTAAELFGAALPGLPPAARDAAVLELSHVELALGLRPQALERLTRLLAETQSAPEVDAAREATVRLALADALLRAGDPAGGLATLAVLTTPPADALRAKLLFFAGRYAEARALATTALERFPAPPATVAAELRHALGLSLFYLGQIEPALAALHQALTEAEAAAEAMLALRIKNSLALVHQRKSDHPAARGFYKDCIAAARALEHLPLLATFLTNLGSLCQLSAHYAEAHLRYEEGLAVAERFGGESELAQVLHNLARLYATLGQPARADGALARSLRLAHGLAWRYLEGQNLLLRAELCLDRGEVRAAEFDLDAAAAIFAATFDAENALQVDLVRARCLFAAGQEVQARHLAGEVGERAAVHPSLNVQASALAARIELGGRAGSAPIALSLLDRAIALCETLGERGLLPELWHLRAQAAARVGDAARATADESACRALLRAIAAELPEALRESYLGDRRRRELWGDDPARSAAHAAAPLARVAPRPGRRGPGAPWPTPELLLALLELNKELNQEPDLERLLERIIDHAVELSGAERGFLLLTPPEEIRQRSGSTPRTDGSQIEGAKIEGAKIEGVKIEVARNIDQETIRKKGFKISRSIADDVMQSGRPLLTVDAMQDGRFEEFLSVHQLKLRSVACVPLTIRRRVRGAIYVDNRFAAESFGEAELQLLTALADQAALVVGNQELIAENLARQEELSQKQKELAQLNAKLAAALDEKGEELAALVATARVQQGELQSRYQFGNLVGKSAPMVELFRLMDRVKDSMAPVYVFGESGTGKELVAKALHYNGPRKDGPFVSVNCAAIPATLLDSELFGYEKGAFTGAARTHLGLIERSNGGTLFLDEIGDMPAELQVKLLRVLQEKRFVRVGGEAELQSDFRLITASNKDLAALVQHGRFREDLFYRVNVIRLRLPPLRERRADIPLLSLHLLARHGYQGTPPDDRLLRLLVAHDWPGNVRELENELLRLVALGGQRIQLNDLSPAIRGSDGDAQRPDRKLFPVAGPGGPTLKQAVATLERSMALQALAAANGSVTRAAEMLGLTRVGLYKLLKRHELAREDVS